MKIGIVGAGAVGKALGTALKSKGHDVRYGVRDQGAAKHRDLGTGAVPVADAVAHGEVVLLAVPWPAVDTALSEGGPWDGKILVDCTNPIKPDFSGLDRSRAPSAAEHIIRQVPDARVVKSFNHTGAGNMADASYPGGKVVNFIASNDGDAARVVAPLSDDIGFDTVLVEDIGLADKLEDMAWLYISLAMKHGMGPNIAYALLRR